MVTPQHWHHIPVHSPNVDELYEDPFDENLDLTFPPLRYLPLFYDRPPPVVMTAAHHSRRRESSRERERLYRELVGHDPYRPITRRYEPNLQSSTNGVFIVKLDVKHYKPDEITLKVDGHSLIITGKHYNETVNGFESSEFQRRYSIPNHIDPHTLTSNITQGGVLCIEGVGSKKKTAQSEQDVVLNENNFLVSLDVSGYSPDELTIRVNARELIVHGETKDEQQTGDVTADTKQRREFTRRYTLPDDVEIEALSSKFTKDSKITIEAPRGKTQTRTVEIKEE